MELIEHHVIKDNHLQKAMSYHDYRQLIYSLLDDGKTTGKNHSPEMLEYTKLNQQRMNKWDKVTHLSANLVESIVKIKKKQYWVLITEAWCGDAAQSVPVIHKMAQENDNIDLRLLLRDEYPEIISHYLTNGGKAIPKLVILDGSNKEELGVWGPRPEEAMKMLGAYKSGEITYEEFAKQLHTWYAKDKTASIQQEFVELINSITKL